MSKSCSVEQPGKKEQRPEHKTELKTELKAEQKSLQAKSDSAGTPASDSVDLEHEN
jgi:hypothetical protein